MATAKFNFTSSAIGGDQFSLVSFSATEAISVLYRYEIEVKAPLAAAIDLDEVLDSPAKFIGLLDGEEWPVHGMLSSIDELKTVQGYVHYRAVLVPRLWWLSIYKSNEIYTEEKTVDAIIQLVLENAEFSSGTDFDLGGLDASRFINRNYRCQFGESDFDFISRLMENEGIFYYFDQSEGADKIVFVNDISYQSLPRPALIFDVGAQTQQQHDSINAWSCRKQRLPAYVTVRDYNPEQPSLDISDTVPIDQMGMGTEYLYGENINDEDEATYLTTIRAEERLCNKTRYYGESSVTRLQAGYVFNLGLHPNDDYNEIDYLAIEVSHEGRDLDAVVSGGPGKHEKSTPHYRNSFVAIEAAQQFRPARTTPKPRFYGTMTAFVYAEAITGAGVAEVDEQGRYRVHLPFDRSDGTRESSDPHRKASTWIRMAQPYVGENEGMYFPLEGGTEVLLTFINGDPDQPVISGALPNASTPSLLTSDTAHMASIVTPGAMVTKSAKGSYTNKTVPLINSANQSSASTTEADIEADLRVTFRRYGPEEWDATDKYSGHFMPPMDFQVPDPDNPGDTIPLESNTDQFPFTKMNDYGQADDPYDYISATEEPIDDNAHIDRGTGPQYVHRVGSTFAYPQQERVYFCGTFHEDFHMDDVGVIGKKRARDADWLMTSQVDPKVDSDPQGPDPEVFHFPIPGTDGAQSHPNGTAFDTTELETRFPPNRVRGVSEDKRWGDQMGYAWGRSFNWSAGKQMGAGRAFGTFNYGNGYTENLITEKGGTSEDSDFPLKDHKDKMEFDAENGWSPSDDPFGAYSGWPGYAATAGGWFNSVAKWLFDYSDEFLHTRSLPTTELRDARKLFPGDTAVEKTFGNTYNYQAGLAVDIHEGHSISRSYGDSEEVITGDANSVVHGDSYSTKVGNNNGFTLGGSHEIFGGAKSEIMLGWDNEIKAGFDTEFKLSGDFTVQIGLDTGLQLAGFLKYTTGFGIDITNGAYIRDETAAVRRQNALVEQKQVEVKDMLTEIRRGAISCEENQLKINKAILLMFA